MSIVIIGMDPHKRSATIEVMASDDAQSAASAAATGPGGQPGNDSDSSAAGGHPERQLFGQATPEPATATLRRATPRRLPTLARPTAKKIRQTS